MTSLNYPIFQRVHPCSPLHSFRGVSQPEDPVGDVDQRLVNLTRYNFGRQDILGIVHVLKKFQIAVVQ